jgi:hypothetical protein
MSAWSKDEIAVLKAHYPEHGMRWVGWESLLPDRSEREIGRKANSLKLRPPVPRKMRPKARPDDSEVKVLFLMRSGLTPSQIDSKMHWVPGRTIKILKARWEAGK